MIVLDVAPSLKPSHPLPKPFTTAGTPPVTATLLLLLTGPSVCMSRTSQGPHQPVPQQASPTPSQQQTASSALQTTSWTMVVVVVVCHHHHHQQVAARA